MTWELMTYSRPRPMVQIIGTIKTQRYASIMDKGLICKMEVTCLLDNISSIDQFIFQLENDPRSDTKATKMFVECKDTIHMKSLV